LQGFPHNDALVIEANIASWTFGKLLVDNGSSADIIFADAFNKMRLSKDLLQPPDMGRGFLNKFEAVIHQAYLCVKIPATQGVITIWGHQNDRRNLERGRTPGQRNVHALDEADKVKEVEKQPKVDREKVNMQPDCDTKRVLLDAMVLD
jgi:hypothetical protein